MGEADSWPAHLIVCGTHGRRGLKRLVLGSDAECVVRHARVPDSSIPTKLIANPGAALLGALRAGRSQGLNALSTFSSCRIELATSISSFARASNTSSSESTPASRPPRSTTGKRRTPISRM